MAVEIKRLKNQCHSHTTHPSAMILVLLFKPRNLVSCFSGRSSKLLPPDVRFYGQNRFRLGLRPRPAWGSLQRSNRSLAGFKGSYFSANLLLLTHVALCQRVRDVIARTRYINVLTYLLRPSLLTSVGLVL